MPGRSGGQTRSPPHTRRRPAAGSFGGETSAAGDPRGSVRGFRKGAGCCGAGLQGAGLPGAGGL